MQLEQTTGKVLLTEQPETVCEISGSHGGKYEDHSILECWFTSTKRQTAIY
jgi:hypothetical protein